MITEAQFITSIDCCFPKNDVPEAIKLIRLAGCISSNAAFMTAYEIDSLSRSSKSTKNKLLQVLFKSFHHPMKSSILRLVMGDSKKRISHSDKEYLIKKLKAYHNQYCALGLLISNACDHRFVIVTDFWKKILHFEEEPRCTRYNLNSGNSCFLYSITLRK